MCGMMMKRGDKRKKENMKCTAQYAHRIHTVSAQYAVERLAVGWKMKWMKDEMQLWSCCYAAALPTGRPNARRVLSEYWRRMRTRMQLSHSYSSISYNAYLLVLHPLPAIQSFHSCFRPVSNSLQGSHSVGPQYDCFILNCSQHSDKIQCTACCLVAINVKQTSWDCRL